MNNAATGALRVFLLVLAGVFAVSCVVVGGSLFFESAIPDWAVKIAMSSIYIGTPILLIIIYKLNRGDGSNGKRAVQCHGADEGAVDASHHCGKADSQ